MAKIIMWIVVVSVTLLVLRLVNIRGSRRRHGNRAGGNAKPAAASMVRCARCGVFLPQADAKRVTDGFVCGDTLCNAKH
jgi:hypothetical protein